MNIEASIDNLFEGGLSEVDKLKAEIAVLKEEKEQVEAELCAFKVDYDEKVAQLNSADECLDMLITAKDTEMKNDKEMILKLQKKVDDLTIKATPTSKHNHKPPFKL